MQFRFFHFEGKQDLERNPVRKIQTYRNTAARFIVMRDQNSESDCRLLKQRLLSLCDQAGSLQHCVVRIACRKLEAFHLADLKAVAVAFELRGLESRQNVSTYRSPDQLGKHKQELKQLTGNRYQPIAGSLAVGEQLDLNNNRSASFRVLIKGIRRLEAELLGT